MGDHAGAVDGPADGEGVGAVEADDVVARRRRRPAASAVSAGTVCTTAPSESTSSQPEMSAVSAPVLSSSALPPTLETSLSTTAVARRRDFVSHEEVLSCPKLFAVTRQKSSDASGHAANAARIGLVRVRDAAVAVAVRLLVDELTGGRVGTGAVELDGVALSGEALLRAEGDVAADRYGPRRRRLERNRRPTP